jgi:hypothetical protein
VVLHPHGKTLTTEFKTPTLKQCPHLNDRNSNGMADSVWVVRTTDYASGFGSGVSLEGSLGASAVTFSGTSFFTFFFSASLGLTTVPVGGRRPLARSFRTSFFLFLLLARSRSFSRLGIVPSSFKVIAQSAKRTATSNHNISKIIKPILGRAPDPKLSGLCSGSPGESAQAADFVHDLVGQEGRIRLSFRKKGRTDPYFHAPSPAHPFPISNAHRDERDSLPEV